MRVMSSNARSTKVRVIRMMMLMRLMRLIRMASGHLVPSAGIVEPAMEEETALVT